MPDYKIYECIGSADGMTYMEYSPLPLAIISMDNEEQAQQALVMAGHVLLKFTVLSDLEPSLKALKDKLLTLKLLGFFQWVVNSLRLSRFIRGSFPMELKEQPEVVSKSVSIGATDRSSGSSEEEVVSLCFL
ncbi:hypothetical protein C5167_039822 [Papaver somniferum]|uniref:Uncharacterized protein n=1 Tax=Papaver somniferum TaxID=3469 RepID=A0A4Y7IGN7_PAPSO|nr:hypothetical protein C5167_039822 [Papaver somniferum]